MLGGSRGEILGGLALLQNCYAQNLVDNRTLLRIPGLRSHTCIWCGSMKCGGQHQSLRRQSVSCVWIWVLDRRARFSRTKLQSVECVNNEYMVSWTCAEGSSTLHIYFEWAPLSTWSNACGTTPFPYQISSIRNNTLLGSIICLVWGLADALLWGLLNYEYANYPN